jgi:hypothetical protein
MILFTSVVTLFREKMLITLEFDQIPAEDKYDISKPLVENISNNNKKMIYVFQTVLLSRSILKIYYCSSHGFLLLLATSVMISIIPFCLNISDSKVLGFFYLSQESDKNGSDKNGSDENELSKPSVIDKSAPVIKITEPSPQSTFPYSTVVVNGTVYDGESGIQDVEAFIHKYPFDDVFEFKKADIISDNNIQHNPNGAEDPSKWSISLSVESPGIYRILAHAKNNAGNESWIDGRFNVPFILDSSQPSLSSSSLKKIALVIPSFTEAAYSQDAFYSFYGKYYPTLRGQNVTQDLNLLDAHLISTFIDPYADANIENFSKVNPPIHPDQPIITLAEHLRKTRQDSLISILRDEDIHNGYIFDSRGVVGDDANPERKKQD